MNVEPPQKGFKTFVILALMGASAFIISQTISTAIQSISKAEITQKPENTKITNINETSATVSWLTQIDTSEYILYGPTPDLGLYQSSSRKSTTHHIKLSALSPNTTYYYKIGVGKKSYDNEENLYKFVTAPQMGSGLSHRVYGQVLDLKGAPAKEAIVYLVIKENDGRGSKGISSTLSALTTTEGIFTIDLAEAKLNDFTSPFYFSLKRDLVEVDVKGQRGEKASILLDTSQLQPVPTIKLSLKGRLQDLRGQGSSDGRDIILPEGPLTKPKRNESRTASYGETLLKIVNLS